MNSSTKAVICAALNADTTLDQEEKRRLLALLRAPPNAPDVPPRLLRHAAVATMLGGVTKKTVNNLARSGVLTPVRLPGRVRALGFRESDVLALIEQRKI